MFVMCTQIIAPEQFGRFISEKKQASTTIGTRGNVTVGDGNSETRGAWKLLPGYGDETPTKVSFVSFDGLGAFSKS